MRMDDIITFRSVTPAQRGQRVLRQSGVEATLQRTPRALAQRGCGYCLRTAPAQRERIVFLLEQAGVPMQGIFSANGAEQVWP